jgi:hypothetical protein
MKRLDHFKQLGVVGVLAMLCATTWTWSSPPAPKDSMPLEGVLSGEVVGTPMDETFVYYDVDVSGKGQMSSLGKVKMKAHHVTDLGTGTFLNGEIKIHGRGGSLVGTYVGSEFPTDSPYVIGAVGTVTFTGGTGQFRGVTGSADFSGLLEIISVSEEGVVKEKFDISLDGSISFR